MKFKPGTDWWPWLVQGVIGTVLGTFIGLAGISSRSHHGFKLDTGLVLPFLTGTALIGLAFGSLELYKPGECHERIFPHDPPGVTGVGKILSILLMIAGVILTLATLARQFHLF